MTVAVTVADVIVIYFSSHSYAWACLHSRNCAPVNDRNTAIPAGTAEYPVSVLQARLSACDWVGADQATHALDPQST